jgi:hypothetical protein
VENEQHLHRPAPDAAYLSEARDDLFVAELEERRGSGHHRCECLLREVPQRRNLGEGESRGAQALNRGRQYLLGGREDSCAARFHEAPQDGVGGGAIELLMSDGLRECLKGMTLRRRLEPARPDGTDQAAEHRIGAREMGENVPAHPRYF